MGEVGNSALYIAADKGFAEMAQLLLAYGADIEAWGHYGDTSLQRAESYGFEEVAWLLAELGAKRG